MKNFILTLSRKLATIVAIVMFAVIIASGVTFVFAQQAKLDQSSLLGQNLEALADGEDPIAGWEGDEVSFYWNNQNWWGKKGEEGWFNGNWFPTYSACQYNGTTGHQVYCTKGDGNCWNGTGCIAD